MKKVFFNPWWENNFYRNGIVGGKDFSIKFGKEGTIDGSQITSLIVFDPMAQIRKESSWIEARFSNGKWNVSDKDNEYVRAILDEVTTLPYIIFK